MIVNATPSTAQAASEEMEVAKAVEQLRVAMIAADKMKLETLSAEELSYGHSGGYVEDKAAFVENIVSGKSDFTGIQLSNQTISIAGNTAVVRHVLDADTNDGGKQGNVHLHVLSVWQKQSGQWKILARQAVKINK